MPKNREKNNQADSEMEAEGLPIFRANVAGIDLGSKKHWVCAPKLGGQGREVESFGATTPQVGKRKVSHIVVVQQIALQGSKIFVRRPSLQSDSVVYPGIV